MKLIINEFGSYLSKKENRFVVKTKEKKEEYSADQIEQIIISSSSSISEGVVKLFFRCYHIQNKGIKECNPKSPIYIFYFALFIFLRSYSAPF